MPISEAQQQFLQRIIRPAQRSQIDTGVPSSVTIAQALLESDWGRSKLAANNNFFGIKAAKKHDGTFNIGPLATGVVFKFTQEVVNGQTVTVEEPFRSYTDIEDSFADHGYFLRDNPRYDAAFLHWDDPNAFARELETAGYATDPHYAEKLIATMLSHNLYQHDLAGVTPPPPWPRIMQGQVSKQVQILQWLLNRLGASLIVDGDFGERTAAAVKNFQRTRGLSADGIVGPKAWVELIVNRRLDDEDEAVKAIQFQLAAKGLSVAATGHFDAATQAAVRSFQASHKLEADGIVGPRTWRRLLQE